MSEEYEFIVRIIERLESAEIPYMLVGSHASAIHGEPRSTNDADFVIDPTPSQLDAFLEMIDEHEYVSAEGARDALRRKSMFNVIDPSIGSKADLICRKDDPFASCEFERRRLADFAGRQVVAASPEDVILSKLRWSRQSESERQLRDAAGIVKVSGTQLDRDYLNHWATKLEVASLLAQVLNAPDSDLLDS